MICAFLVLETPSKRDREHSVKTKNIVTKVTTWVKCSNDSLVARKYFRWGHGHKPIEKGDIVYLNVTPQNHFRLISKEKEEKFYNNHLEYFI